MKRIRFLGDHGNGNGAKRSQVRRACDACRKGKRKCRHVPEGTSVQSEEDMVNETMIAEVLLDDRNPPEPETYQLPDLPNFKGTYGENQQSSLVSSPRPVLPFTGPSSARSLLLSAYVAPNTVGPSPVEMDGAYNLPHSRLLRPSFQDMRAPASERRPGVRPGYLPMVVRAVLPYLEIECLQVLPPQPDLDALIQIFKEEVHPILPIVDFSTRALTEPANRENPASIVLRQAICLAACKNDSARQHLHLPDCEEAPTPSYTPRLFADRLFGVLKIAQDIGLVDDRLELIQVLALMTFHSYGIDGDDEVARLCGQSVHYAFSVGLHYPSRPEDPIPEIRRVELLCSLFALDKIVAVITGRPAMIRSNEICLPAHNDDVLKSISPGLALLYRLCQMLDRVLDLYRARAPDELAREDCIWEASWPEFDDLARECNIQVLQPSLQACLELFYHTIGIISYRPPQAPIGEERTSETTPLPTIQSAKIRNKYCAQKILLLLSMGTSKFPFVPYAASLSLTVTLRNMQQTTLESTRMMAKKDVETNINLLEGLIDMYWHAESAATIARQIFQTLP
ncbi:uncharacterized protein F4822DRAFT_380028 [Hypoxylon trugodes]|uniref:uncharacterized protein n=1 Tax=Hypoxylon trugodes TaxID=326681 RepID=UPI00218DC548|nr:uncharacterized protein F4822DRAFT_380028 [Hypoxylon trugodes]KAI1385002.1 hypothetical protein F4822DRAFT_380028 [Hypoxylon trugodes]